MKRPSQKKPAAAGVKKPAKAVAKARKPAGKSAPAKKPATPSHASSDSMGTTLVLGEVSPHSGCDDDQGNDIPAVPAVPPSVFPLPDDVIPTSLPGPLPDVDLDDGREPSIFALECAPCGWLMHWDLLSRPQQLYIWAHHESIELYPVAGGDTAGHKQAQRLDIGFTLFVSLLVLFLLGYTYIFNHYVGQGEADGAADEAPSLDALFPRAQGSSLAIDSSGVIRGIHQ